MSERALQSHNRGGSQRGIDGSHEGSNVQDALEDARNYEAARRRKMIKPRFNHKSEKATPA
jgi:hypothetical protein